MHHHHHHRSAHPGRLTAALSLSAVLTLTAGACGGSQTDTELREAILGRSTSVTTQAPDGAAAPVAPATPTGDETTTAAPDATSASADGGGRVGPGAVTGSALAGVRPAMGGVPRSGIPPNPTRSSGAGNAAGTAGAAPVGGAGSRPSAPVEQATNTPTGKPAIKFGVLGTRTGAVGALFIPFYEGARAWQADVNARGGLNGHQVDFVVADDGGDPRRALAAARHMVEEDHVTAFFAEHTPFSLGAILPYLEKKAVPVVGGAALDPAGEDSPMIFYLKPGPKRGLAWSFISGLAYSDAKDIGLLYCREAPVCQAAYEGVKALAPQMKKNVKFEVQMSVAQPDYTAEVLAARSAGAQALVIIADNNTAARVASAAHRQDWHPDMATAGAILAEKNLKENGADLVGMYTGAYGPHWTSPLLARYVAATRKYLPDGLGLAAHSINIWVAGLLLEKISVNFPDGDVAPADVLRALWGVKNETLDGLIPPMTFAQGTTRNHHECSIPMQIGPNLDAVPLGTGAFVCAPGYQPGG